MYDNDDFMIDYEIPTPAEEEEMRKILADGKYDFSVTDAVIGKSQKGDDMLTLKFNVFDLEGKVWSVRDWFVLTKNQLFKLRNFWAAVGHPEKYGQPLKKSELIDQYGTLMIVSRAVVDKDTGETKYFPSVKGYVFDKNKKPKEPPVHFVEDDLPNFN